jgi:hypothetical protein
MAIGRFVQVIPVCPVRDVQNEQKVWILHYIVGLLIGALLGTHVGTSNGNEPVGIAAGARVGVFLGWFVAAAVYYNKKNTKERKSPVSAKQDLLFCS